jgi:precorrin-6B methylase 2
VSALEWWAEQLRQWEIPAHVLAGASESPWVLPRSVFTRRADAQIADPIGASHLAQLAALGSPGTVLDVGAAAGASSLPLVGRAPVTEIIAVDTDAELLRAFAFRADALGARTRGVHGAWPQVAWRVGIADVVVAGNVVYNVTDLGAFAMSLSAHARRLVVVEMSVRHPLTELNPLWLWFHGVARPEGPTARDCVDALAEVGIRPWVRRWRRPAECEYVSYAELVDVVRRRVCLPVRRSGEVDHALRELGIDQDCPPDLGSSGRELVMLAWEPR